MAKAPFQPLLLELPLLLAILGFSAALMGLSGSHLHQFSSVADKLEFQASINNFVVVETNGIKNVDLAMLIVGAISFAFSGLAIVLSCGQFKGRRGEYSGKGTGAWLLVGLVLLLLSGAWAGIAGAYTAYSVQKVYTFAPGSAYFEPFGFDQALLLRQVDRFLKEQTTQSLRVNQLPGAVGLDQSFIGEWADVTTLAQANAITQQSNYLQTIFSYKAAVAVVWVELAVVFFTMVVHFALPFVWKWLGLLREDEKNGRNYQEF